VVSSGRGWAVWGTNPSEGVGRQVVCLGGNRAAPPGRRRGSSRVVDLE
jgi:hypothetical protein